MELPNYTELKLVSFSDTKENNEVSEFTYTSQDNDVTWSTLLDKFVGGLTSLGYVGINRERLLDWVDEHFPQQ